VAVFLVAVVILAVVLNQPNYQVLTTCKDYTELSEVTALLKSNSYDYKVADNSLIVQVPKAKLTDANVLVLPTDVARKFAILSAFSSSIVFDNFNVTPTDASEVAV